MNFTFINLTTALPVDCELKEYFELKMSKEFRCALGQPNRFTDPFLKHTPIFFVCKLPFEDGADSLGRYYPAHKENRQPIIEICPEEIFKSFKTKKNKSVEGHKLDFYPCLVASVIFHEISHFIMDISEKGVSKRPRAPWSWAIKDSEKAHQFLESTSDQLGSYSNAPNAFRFVEESLANAIMLRQEWGPSEYDFLREFTQRQPNGAGYRQALQWVGSLDQTLKTAHSLAILKHQKILGNTNADLGNLKEDLINGKFLDEKNFINELNWSDFKINLPTREVSSSDL